MTESAIDTLHNAPPDDADPLRDRLSEEHAGMLDRRDELLAAAKRAPDHIGDEETAGKVADFIKQIAAAVKNAEGTRVKEKEPFLESGRAVDGFFKKITDPLKDAKKDVERVLTDYQRRKADAERRAREEEERAAKAEADRLRREAEEKAAQVAEEKDLDSAIEAEAEANRAAEDAEERARAADANAADLSRSRGDHGAVASLRTNWVGELVDRDTLDLEALRQHIPTDGLEKAIRSFVKAGGRDLKGAKIYEHHHTVVT